MRLPKWMQVCLVVWMSASLAASPLSAADDVAATTVPINRAVQHVVLQNGQLQGMLVDAAGTGVADAPVVIGKQGKLLKTLRTDDEGRFRLLAATPGVYQVVSHGGAEVYRTWQTDDAPDGAKQGIIHQVAPQVARGGHPGGLIALLTNPIFLALLIGAAIAIPLALDDDDDNS